MNAAFNDLYNEGQKLYTFKNAGEVDAAEMKYEFDIVLLRLIYTAGAGPIRFEKNLPTLAVLKMVL